MKTYLKKVTLTIESCTQCPNCKTERTMGAGYAMDYLCKKKNNKLIVGYVEWPSEEPQKNQIPIWCPLKKVIKNK